MSYLLDFVKTFDENEMEQFRRLDLKGKEEQIRDAYLHVADKKFNETTFPAKYELSQAHFDKITSVLLDKIIDRLYEGDYNKTLSVILNKGLTQLMLHELKILERRVLKRADKKEYPVFYLAAFNNLRNMFHPGYNSKLTHQYGKKYLDSLGSKKTIADESYVEMLTLGADTTSNRLANTDKGFVPASEKKLALWQKKTAKANDPVATFYYAFAQLTFLKSMTDDAEGFKKSVDLFYKSYFASPPGAIGDKFKGLVYFESGFACMEVNDFDGAYKNYSKIRTELKEIYANNVYHTGHYIMACVLTKHYDEAVKAFHETFKPRIDLKLNRSMLFDIQSITCMIYLHKGDYDEAFKYIKEMQTYRSTEITRFGQGILRMVDTLYYLIIGDYKTAAVFTKRNLKFLKAENAKAAINPFHMHMMEVMNKMVKAKKSSKPQKMELHKLIDGLQKGILTVYTSLLTQVVDRDFK